MKSSLLRTSAVTGMAAVAALAITACSPALENPSPDQTNTATEAADTTTPGATGTAEATDTDTTGTAEPTAAETAEAAAGDPAFIDCVAAPVQTPNAVSLSCADNSDNLVDIDWEEWGVEEATGTGTREVLDPETGEVEAEDDIEIILASPFEGPQGLVFTEITVDGVIVNP